jgi:hypothetical protein
MTMTDNPVLPRDTSNGAIRVATATVIHEVADPAALAAERVPGHWEVDVYLDETLYGPKPIRISHPFPVKTASYAGAKDYNLADVIAVALAEPDRQDMAARGINVRTFRWAGTLRTEFGIIACVVVDWS